MSAGSKWGIRVYRADLVDTDLFRADLGKANLRLANFAGAYLVKANLGGTSLQAANFAGADLRDTNLAGAELYATIFGNVDLSDCSGLESCVHRGPSIIDHRTLQRSGPLPLAFLRGVGLPDNLIDYLPSLLNQPIQFYSCFISYSHEDKSFARRLHDQLQGRGIRCWLDDHQMLPGDDIYEQVDRGIRLWDKLLPALSDQLVGGQ